MKLKHLHPLKMGIFAAAIFAGLIIGWIYHVMNEKEEQVTILVATQHIEEGQRLLPIMFDTRVTSPRHLPSNLIPPENTSFFVGLKAKRAIEIDEPLQQHLFERNEKP